MIDVAPADALDAAASNAMEGIVLKRLDSPYRPGERSPFWVKVPVRATTELIIVGYWCAGGPGGRTAVGSLLMAGHNEAGDLVAIGQVGTGFSAAMRRHLYAQLQPTRRSTHRGRWLRGVRCAVGRDAFVADIDDRENRWNCI